MSKNAEKLKGSGKSIWISILIIAPVNILPVFFFGVNMNNNNALYLFDSFAFLSQSLSGEEE